MITFVIGYMVIPSSYQEFKILFLNVYKSKELVIYQYTIGQCACYDNILLIFKC